MTFYFLLLASCAFVILLSYLLLCSCDWDWGLPGGWLDRRKDEYNGVNLVALSVLCGLSHSISRTSSDVNTFSSI